MSKKEIALQDLMKQLTDASIKWTHDELMDIITHAHHNVPCAGDKDHSKKALENPLDDLPHIEVVHVIAVNDHPRCTPR